MLSQLSTTYSLPLNALRYLALLKQVRLILGPGEAEVRNQMENSGH